MIRGAPTRLALGGFAVAWAWGRSLGPGLTSDSADAAQAVFPAACRPGPSPGIHRRCRPDLPGLGRGRGSRVRRPAGACHPSTVKGTAMTTMVEDTRVITGGVDTHADMHVAAALDSVGGLLGVQEFPATAAGYASLLSWLRSFGILAVAGVEGTGSYGAGLARHLHTCRHRRRQADQQSPQTSRTATPSAASSGPAPTSAQASPSPSSAGTLPCVPCRPDTCPARPPSRPSCGSPPASAIRKSPSAAHRPGQSRHP